MLIYSVLKKQKNNLKFLGNSEENVEVVARTFKDFKKHNVSQNILKDTIDKVEDKYLLAKLNDINLVYSEYEEKLKGKYIDEDDYLTILAGMIEQSDMFKDALIYIDEFVGFTKQEYIIITSLLKLAKMVTVTVCTDSEEMSNMSSTDIFQANKETIIRLKKCANEANSTALEPVKLRELYRFKNEEIKHLEENIYSVKYKKYDNEVKNISLHLAQNPYLEVEYVAKNIVKLVRDKKLRYRDIAVITKNVNTYSSLIKAIFPKYKIPVFVDEERELSQNVLIKYILSILDIFSNNWSYESMFNYIKSGFLDLKINEIFALENYCRQYGIKGKKWYEDDFKVGVDDEQVAKINELRLKVVTPLVELKSKINKNRTAEQLSKELYEFFVNNNIFDKMNKKIEYLRNINEIDIANEYEASVNLLISLLDEIVMIFKDDNITFDNYKDLLKIGFLNSSLKNIPATLDQVIIGDVDRTRSHKVKAMFIIGLNDGVFPSVNKDEGFLSDDDRSVLKELDIEIAKGTKEQLYEDQFNIYKAFSTAEEKVYLSYPSTDRESKSLRPSIMISKIKKLYPTLIETSDVIVNTAEIITDKNTFEGLLANLRAYADGENIDSVWFNVYNLFSKDNEWKDKLQSALYGINYTNKPEKIKETYLDKLYGNTLKTSVSRLEQYKNCPFSFHLKYGLNIKETETNQLKSMDTGSFMHEVIDEFFETIKHYGVALNEYSKEDIRKIVNKIIEDKLKLKKNYIFTSSQKFIALTNKLKKVIFQSVEYIVYQLSVSNFEVLGTEIAFENGKNYPPITLDLEDGKKIEITGKIDRVDIAKMNDGKYIRIIDYKSSAKNIELNKVVAGLQIQLLTYMDAITRVEDVLPAGVLYFNLIEPMLKKQKNVTDEEIEEEIKKQFKMKGLVLADINVIKMMDNKLDKGYSSILPVYVNKDGDISENKSSVASKEEFDKMQKYIMKLIKQISKEILSGNIDIKPVYNVNGKKTPCDYCSYRSICKFNSNENQYDYIGNLSNEECLNLMKEE